jgi:hypothetical protein
MCDHIDSTEDYHLLSCGFYPEGKGSTLVVPVYHTTQCHVPEESTLHENLKSDNISNILCL